MKMKTAKVIILAGQSNAVGVGHTSCLPKHFSAEKVQEYKNGYENILINYFSHDISSVRFEKTRTGCAEKTKDTFGPEIGIAEFLSKKYPDEKFFIVKCAFGGTNLYHDWLSPSSGGEYDSRSCALGDSNGVYYRKGGWCYNELVKLVHQSIFILECMGCETEICAFCWMQGESDAFDMQHVNNYRKHYENMLMDFNSVFGDFTKNCVWVDAGISETWQYYREINEHKKEHAKNTVNSFYIDTLAHGLTTLNEPEAEPDTAHYDSDCTVKLGALFAREIIKGKLFAD